MDEAEGGEEVVDASDGVTLRKRLETADFHQPAVVYEFTSDRDVDVDVRLIESIPDGLPPEDLGFLGSSTERTWEIKGPKLVLEKTLEPGASFTTACAARGDRAGAITELLGHPDAFEVTETGTAATAEPEPAAPADGDHEPVVERFVEELRAGDVSEDSVEFLRSELGARRPPRSVEVRLKQLQADVADVRAYTNALEAFIDEHGSADELVGGLESRLVALEETVADLEGLRADVVDLEADVAALSRELEDVAEELEADRGVEDVAERVDELEAELSDVARFADSLKSAFEN